MSEEKWEKFDERLRALELSESNTTGQLGRVASHLESEAAHLTRGLTRLDEVASEIRSMVVGNGKPGLGERVRSLEKKEEDRGAREAWLVKWVIGLVGSVLSLAGALAWQILTQGGKA